MVKPDPNTLSFEFNYDWPPHFIATWPPLVDSRHFLPLREHVHAGNIQDWRSFQESIIRWTGEWGSLTQYRTTEDWRRYHLYRTPIDQAMARPMGEAPDIDVLSEFMDPDYWQSLLNEVSRFSDDATERYDYLDETLGEKAMREYHIWIWHAWLAALVAGDNGKIAFYKGLEQALGVDRLEVTRELEEKKRLRLQQRYSPSSVETVTDCSEDSNLDNTYSNEQPADSDAGTPRENVENSAISRQQPRMESWQRDCCILL